MNQLDIIIDALDVSESLFYDQTKLQEALQSARELQALQPVAWELRQGKTDRVLLQITNDAELAHKWKCSLEEVVPLYALDEVKK
jgi:hypothetical protein